MTNELSLMQVLCSKNLTKMGAMHLLAVNLWTWKRFVMTKNAALGEDIFGEKNVCNINR